MLEFLNGWYHTLALILKTEKWFVSSYDWNLHNLQTFEWNFFVPYSSIWCPWLVAHLLPLLLPHHKSPVVKVIQLRHFAWRDKSLSLLTSYFVFVFYLTPYFDITSLRLVAVSTFFSFKIRFIFLLVYLL